MKVATWNVNSIRTRLDHIVGWLNQNPIDVLCLQETKVVDADFPQAAFKELGYSPYFVGQKSYNGVAILSRLPVEAVSTGFAALLADGVDEDTRALITQLDEQKRVITVMVEGIRIVNLYVPNGSEIGSEKYHYKLTWLGVLRQYLATVLQQSDRVLVCGDFNIALENRDIYTDKDRDTHIMSSPVERQALRDSILSLGFIDAFRQFTAEGGHFSWWDYRTGAFQRNRGWRIDHHYLSPALAPQAIACTIDKAPRQLEKPSDHTPVIVELA